MLYAQGISTPLYAQVPVGKVWIVRDVDIYCNSGGSPSTIFMQILAPPPTKPAFFAGKIAAATSDSVQWRGRQVLHAGEYLQCDPNGSTCDVTVSGYEFDA
jgi:hypothetical protein